MSAGRFGGSTRRSALAAPLALAATACGLSAGSRTSMPTTTPEPSELLVLAASSLTDAFTELAEVLPKQPGFAGTRIVMSFGASSQLRVQLEQGAPADVFESADAAQMELAVRAGLIDGAPVVFARNRLVAIVPRESRAGINTLADLARPGVKVVSTARDVPIGAYTIEALGKLAADPAYGPGFDARVLANVVSEEMNVRQIVAKVQLGEADAGFVYASEISPRLAPDVRVLDVPERFQPRAEHLIGVTRSARAPALAQRLVDHLLTPPGQTLLKRYGFLSLD